MNGERLIWILDRLRLRSLAERAVVLFGRNLRISLRIGELLITVETIDRLLVAVLWKLSLLEKTEADFVRRVVQPGMTVLDLGANIGLYTLLLARRVGPNGHVYAFEPAPDNCRLLSHNLHQNQADNVTVIPKAASDTVTSRVLFCKPGHDGDHRVYPVEGHVSAAMVPATSVDAELPNLAVDFVKIDIQGSETAALRGMAATIERSQRLMMLCEYSPHLLAEAGTSESEFWELLDSLSLEARLSPSPSEIDNRSVREQLRGLAADRGEVSLYLAKREVVGLTQTPKTGTD